MRAYLVGVKRPEFPASEAQEHLEELERLVDTMGLPVAGKEMATLNAPTASLLLGSGKVAAIKAAAESQEANVIVVDDELSPGQQRNWEKETGMAVIDRREVILDIFRQRARTKEARLQVELAGLEYSLPRLKRAWTHLEKQRGGSGMRGGQGEMQIEADRRIVGVRIAKVKEELAVVRRQRATQRAKREDNALPTIAIVGYTNSGKSTLLNTLTHAGVLSENKLFATLDPTTRRLQLPSNQDILLTDTVGFIRKLPHGLVEAFKATLEETQLADMLLHVVDASHEAAPDQIAATNKVLEELGAVSKPTLFVLNKIDLATNEVLLAKLKETASPHIATSAIRGDGIVELSQYLIAYAAERRVSASLRIPASRYDLVSLVHREGRVLSEKFDGDDVLLEAEMGKKTFARVAEFAELAPASA